MSGEPLRAELYTGQNPVYWNALVSQLPYGHVLQSYQWGQFKSRHGWSAYPLLFTQRETIKGAALVLRRALPHLPWGIMYVPKGPALDYSDVDLVIQALSELENFARDHRALLIKIDPDVAFDDDDPDWVEPRSSVAAPGAAGPLVDLLTRRGWLFSNEQVQFKNTLLIDLRLSEELLLAHMKPKTRYNVRLAARKGVTVRLGEPNDLPAFYRLYVETGERDRFLIRPFEYYRDVWQAFLADGLGELLLAEWEGKLLAGLMLFRLGHKAWYFYGASAGEARHLMPNYILQWEAMCRCRRQGCLLYDLWGAPDTLNETEPMWGVYRFKEGLGGRFVRHIGAYDFPANPLLFNLYSQALPRYLSFLRSRHGPSMPSV